MPQLKVDCLAVHYHVDGGWVHDWPDFVREGAVQEGEAEAPLSYADVPEHDTFQLRGRHDRGCLPLRALTFSVATGAIKGV